MLLVLAAVLTGLLMLYTVVRLAVRDGVLDARAKDDADLAQRTQRTQKDSGRRSRTTVGEDPSSLDELLDR